MQNVIREVVPSVDGAAQAPVAVSPLQCAALGAPERFIDVGHSRLAYWKIGSGPDVVFIHGWPLHSATFRGIVPLLAPHFTCHLLDLPGAGLTISKPDAPLDFVSHARALARATELLGLERYALVAHDSGGLVARFIAAKDPRVTALVLGDTEVPDHVPAVIRIHALLARVPFGPDLVRLLLRWPFVRASAIGFGGCFSDPAHLTGEFHELFVRPLLNDAAYAARQFAVFHNLDFGSMSVLPSLHAAIRAPALLIWGDEDPFFPIDLARRMMSQFGGTTELAVLEGGKVFVHDERPAEFAGLALRFLLAQT